jgi:transcriptional regulator with XRE-family HTH domain
MAERQSPTVRRRRLASELRRLRDEAGVTSVEVSKRLEWSPGKLTRMERNEGKRYDPNDIKRLCDEIYGTDARTRDYLMQLARDGRLKGWWEPYDEQLSEALSTYIGLEAEAEMLLMYQTIVPGLFQTEAYARSLAQAVADVDAAALEDRVRIRMKRQEEVLEGRDAVRVWAVLDEAAVRRQVGGPEVMQEQLERLLTLARRPGITLQVIPFDVGAHRGAGTPSFTILQFPHEADRDAVHADNVAGELFIEEARQVDQFHVAHRHLIGAALSPADTVNWVAVLAACT